MVQEEGEMKMGWLYFTLRKKDVFVSGIETIQENNMLVAVWWNDEEQAWKCDYLKFFQPPQEKHK